MIHEEALHKRFWEKVHFVYPDAIKPEDDGQIGVVSDENINWLINEVYKQTIEECIGCVPQLKPHICRECYEECIEVIKKHYLQDN